MTKGELIKLLEPFVDDIEIYALDAIRSMRLEDASPVLASQYWFPRGEQYARIILEFHGERR